MGESENLRTSSDTKAGQSTSDPCPEVVVPQSSDPYSDLTDDLGLDASKQAEKGRDHSTDNKDFSPYI